MKNNVCFSDLLPNHLSVIRRLTDILEKNFSIKVVSDLRNQPRFFFPEDPTIISADEELVSQFIPTPKITQRITLTVDDMHNPSR